MNEVYMSSRFTQPTTCLSKFTDERDVILTQGGLGQRSYPHICKTNPISKKYNISTTREYIWNPWPQFTQEQLSKCMQLTKKNLFCSSVFLSSCKLLIYSSDILMCPVMYRLACTCCHTQQSHRSRSWSIGTHFTTSYL